MELLADIRRGAVSEGATHQFVTIRLNGTPYQIVVGEEPRIEALGKDIEEGSVTDRVSRPDW